MLFVNTRNELAAAAASKVAAAGGSRLQNSGFANTVLAPILANKYPFVITPYLGLRAKLSQIWINRWTILLILVLVRTLIAVANLHDDIESARKEALSACSGVEDMGSAMASMPHYMSQGVNALTADGVERAVNGLMSMLTLTVTGVEEIVLFVINMLTSTYICLITLVVRGALHAAIDLIEGASHFLNQTLGAIGDGLHTTVDDFQSAYNDFIGGLNDVGSIFGAGGSIPHLDISKQLDELNNVQLPSGLDADLEALSKQIPTFNQVHQFTNEAIRFPFEEIKKLINESLPKYQFNRNVFPVPQKKKLTFCSDGNGIDDFFNNLVDLGIFARKLTIAVLVILAVLVCAPMAWLEVRRHRKLRERSALVRDSSTAPMDAVYIASRPFTADAGLKVASAFKASRRQALVRWAVAYATTVPALFVLSLGIAGLFSCLARYLILRAVQHEVPQLVDQVSDFAGEVVTSLEHASEAWANGTNTMILDINGKINEDVFGWVNTSTHALNHTLNVFVDESIGALHTAFGGTVLFGPVKELFNCLIGLKITGIEKALTWIHQHAHIDFPLLPNNTFSLGAAASIADDSSSGSGGTASSFLANPSGGTTDKITEAVNSLAEKIKRSIRTEAIISSCVVAVWVVVALIGVVRALYLFYGKGHMPADMPAYADDLASPTRRTADSLDGASEKSPSFVGDFIHSPAQLHTRSMDVRGEKTPPMPQGTMRSTSSSTRSSPPGYTSSSETQAAAHSGNQYNGTSYTITPRPFPQFSKEQPSTSSGPSSQTPQQQYARPLSPVPENVGYAGERGVRDATKTVGEVRRSQHGAFGASGPGQGSSAASGYVSHSRGGSGGNGGSTGGQRRGANGNVTFDRMGYCTGFT